MKGRQSPGVKPRTPLAWAANALPLSHDSRTTTNPHNPLLDQHKTHSQVYCTCICSCAQTPTSTSHSHHVIGVPRPYPFSTTLLYLCIILSVNQRTKKGKAWECGWGANKCVLRSSTNFLIKTDWIASSVQKRRWMAWEHLSHELCQCLPR